MECTLVPPTGGGASTGEPMEVGAVRPAGNAISAVNVAPVGDGFIASAGQGAQSRCTFCQVVGHSSANCFQRQRQLMAAAKTSSSAAGARSKTTSGKEDKKKFSGNSKFAGRENKRRRYMAEISAMLEQIAALDKEDAADPGGPDEDYVDVPEEDGGGGDHGEGPPSDQDF